MRVFHHLLISALRHEGLALLLISLQISYGERGAPEFHERPERWRRAGILDS
ncbi:hypothetical protein D3C71_1966300 [compost metagenome]